MKGFVAVVDYGRTVQSDIYIGHNFIIANFRLRCSQHWETLPLIVHHLVGHLHTHTQEPDVNQYTQRANGFIKLSWSRGASEHKMNQFLMLL